MKKLLLLAAVAALTMNATLWGQGITVTSPVRGDSWCLGSTHTITWTKSGAMPATVAVRLRRAGAPDTEAAVVNITSSTANSGSLSWTVPASVPAGDYFIRIRTTSPAVVGNSGIFHISSCAPASASITVTSPTAGIEWCQGRTYSINWTKSGTMPATVDINLCRAETEAPHLTIMPFYANSGSLSWTVPASVPAGDYFIRVRTTSPAVIGDSGIFHISNCLPHLTLPNTPIVLPRGVISGRISGIRPTRNIAGHQVRVVLEKEGVQRQSAVYMPDVDGLCNYQFTNLSTGTYEVKMFPVPDIWDPVHWPPAVLYVCFNYVTPAVHTVVLASETHATGNDFIINYTVRSDYLANCW